VASNNIRVPVPDRPLEYFSQQYICDGFFPGAYPTCSSSDGIFFLQESYTPHPQWEYVVKDLNFDIRDGRRTPFWKTL